MAAPTLRSWSVLCCSLARSWPRCSTPQHPPRQRLLTTSTVALDGDGGSAGADQSTDANAFVMPGKSWSVQSLAQVSDAATTTSTKDGKASEAAGRAGSQSDDEISTDQLAHLAKLCRLHVGSGDDAEVLRRDVTRIVTYVKQIQAVDTTGVDPCLSPLSAHYSNKPGTSPLPPLREDVVTEGGSQPSLPQDPEETPVIEGGPGTYHEFSLSEEQQLVTSDPKTQATPTMLSADRVTFRGYLTVPKDEAFAESDAAA
eukprot:m.491062 g.491062  ORF g.491062 m.491062 type:complete len:257 (-) comp29154_c0_seq1:140-910(-)